ncbi:hypothetical protein [Chitinophaga pinensis]|uniref:Uncharacterized protein n=1 Tax=Chitinophaga pinensis TaxID=79329 RepID=A0A5C6LQD4_9BACT|nr:hypothetical protein [Chitinophaga pinensis]TWV98776.1 hypothetical protein FEF09_20345 [Chitinophaga pinensis]
MRYLYLFVLIALLCNCRTTQSFRHIATTASDTLVRIATWGYPDRDSWAAQQELSHKWGFYYELAGNCTIEQSAIDSLTRLNEIAERPLVKKYGKHWRSRFGREVNIMSAKPQTMYLLSILNMKETWDTTKAFEMRRDTLFYYFTPTPKKGIYLADAIGWTHHNGVKTWGSLMRYHAHQPTLITRIP